LGSFDVCSFPRDFPFDLSFFLRLRDQTVLPTFCPFLDFIAPSYAWSHLVYPSHLAPGSRLFSLWDFFPRWVPANLILRFLQNGSSWFFLWLPFTLGLVRPPGVFLVKVFGGLAPRALPFFSFHLAFMLVFDLFFARSVVPLAPLNGRFPSPPLTEKLF